MPTVADWKVCGVCGVALSKITHPDGQIIGWRHPSIAEPADHPAIPVDIGEVPQQLHCDFCGIAGEMHWELPVRDFQIGHHISRNNYAACDACADLLRVDDITGLVDRMCRVFDELGKSRPRAAVLFGVALVLDHQTGPLQPYNAKEVG